ncbi:MAG: hypothetical protein R3356_08045 [Eudoraea sp.]|nr:hypothetical protein [Eudoraea sp.]
MFDMANQSFAEASKVGMVRTSTRRSFYGMYGMGRGQQGSQSQNEWKPARKVLVDINIKDLKYFTDAAAKYGEFTGIKTQPPVRKPEGAFFEFGYFQFGALSFSSPGWGPDLEDAEEKNKKASGGAARGAKNSAADKKLLTYFDNKDIAGFVDWESHSHPDLGEVEIGGFSPYMVSNPPASEIDKLGLSHAEFAVWLSGLYADVSIVKTEVINHGGGIFRIKAEIENSGFLPTALSHGVTSRSVSPTMVQLGVDPEAIVSGNAKTSFFQSLDGSGKREKYEWLVKGKSGDTIELKLVSQKAGSDSKVITLE